MNSVSLSIVMLIGLTFVILFFWPHGDLTAMVVLALYVIVIVLAHR